jgi:hypothetical protein
VAQIDCIRRVGGLDVVVVTETWLTSHDTIRVLARSMGASYVGVNFPRDPHAQGRSMRGVGVLVFNRDIRITMEKADPVGLLSVGLHMDGYAPVSVIGVYAPPAAAVRDGAGHPPLRVVYDLAYAEFVRLSALQRYALVLLAGDFNQQPGTYKGRTTPCVPARAALNADLVELMDVLGVQPVHGRSPATPAIATSRSMVYHKATRVGVEHSTEVDLILAGDSVTPACCRPLTPADLMKHDNNPGIKLTPEARQWEMAPSTHIWVGVMLTLVPLPPGIHGPPIATPRTMPIGPYGDPRWGDAAHAVEAALESAPSPSAEARVDPDMALSDLLALAVQPAAAVFATPLNHSASRKPGETRPLFRQGKGGAFPPKLVKICASARMALRARNSLPADAPERDAANATLRQRNTERRQEIRRHLKRTETDLRNKLLMWSHREPHRFARWVQDTRDGDPLIADAPGTMVHQPGQPPPVEVFGTFFENLAKETRGLQPAVSDPLHWQFVPVAPPGSGGHLADPVTAWEVYRVVYPLSPRCLPRLREYCCPECRICAATLQQMEAHLANPDLVPVPTYRPCLKTSTAAGPDGLPPEMFRFVRSADRSKRFDLRMRVAERIAVMVSAALTAGRMPSRHADGTLHQTQTPLLKPAAAGHRSDPADPNYYRAITTSGVETKIVGLVLLQRLTHWVETHRLLSPAQIGFRQGLSSQMHILTLLETVRNRRRAGSDTYVVFVDFRKAYDSVHLDTLWRMLLHMGVPGTLVNLLRQWGRQRWTRVKVNGKLSWAFLSDKGLPQGCVLSPLLFNLFLESLHHYLLALPGYNGVTVYRNRDRTTHADDVTIREQTFADDVALACKTPEEALVASAGAVAWANAWGMTLGIGAGKTEAIAFTDPALPRAALAPLVTAHGTIPWVDKYRYLGYHVRWDLDEAHIRNRLPGAMKYAARKLMYASPLVRSLPLSTQVQLLRTYVLSTLTYLAPLLQLTQRQWKPIDSAFSGIIRDALPAGGIRGPPSMPSFVTNIVPAPTLALVHRQRIVLTIKHLPELHPDALVTRVMTCVAAGQPGTNIAHAKSWLSYTASAMAALNKLLGYTVPCPDPVARHDIHREVARFTFRAGAGEWRALVVKRDKVITAHAGDASVRPRHLPQQAALADVMLVGQRARVLEEADRHPALSVLGPGGVGPIWTMSRLTPNELRAPIQAAYGKWALYMRPWVTVSAYGTAGLDPDGQLRVTTATGDVHMTVKELGRRRNTEAHCPVCFSASEVEDPWHVAHECTAAHVVSARLRIHATVGAMLAAVLRGLIVAHEHVSAVHVGLLADVEAAVATLVPPVVVEVVEEIAGEAAPIPPPHLPPLEWDSAEGQFILFRLLLMLPFPATAAGPGQTHVARLGRVFDQVRLPRRHLTRFIRPWVRWAAHHMSKLVAARKLAHKEKGAKNRAKAALAAGVQPAAAPATGPVAAVGARS